MLRKFIDQRGIKFLYHFTHINNLSSILEHGILSKTELKKRNILYKEGDSNRYDRILDSSCFSVSHPNFSMLHKLRIFNGKNSYVIIELDIDVIIKCNLCYFFEDNATKKPVMGYSYITEKYAFMRMFNPNPCAPYPHFPVNDQAEIMIHGIIGPEFFTRIYFPSIETLRESLYITAKYNIDCLFKKDIFQRREDLIPF